MILIRYDMLCFEGISLMLNIFLGRKSSPNYRLVAPPNGELEAITVHEEVRNPKFYLLRNTAEIKS